MEEEEKQKDESLDRTQTQEITIESEVVQPNVTFVEKRSNTFLGKHSDKLILFFIFFSSIATFSIICLISTSLPGDLPHLEGVLHRFLSSFDIYPITEIQFTKEECPVGFVASNLGTFPGLTESTKHSLVLYPHTTFMKWGDYNVCIKQIPPTPTTNNKCPNSQDKYCRYGFCVSANDKCPLTSLEPVKGKSKLEKIALPNGSHKIAVRDPVEPYIISLEYIYGEKPCAAEGFSASKEQFSPRYIQKWDCGKYGFDNSAIILDSMNELEFYQKNGMTKLPDDFVTLSSKDNVKLVARKSSIKDSPQCRDSKSLFQYFETKYNRINSAQLPLIISMGIIDGFWVFLFSFYFASVVRTIEKRGTGASYNEWITRCAILVGAIELLVVIATQFALRVDPGSLNRLQKYSSQECVSEISMRVALDDVKDYMGYIGNNLFMLNSLNIALVLSKIIVVVALREIRTHLLYQRLNKAPGN